MTVDDPAPGAVALRARSRSGARERRALASVVLLLMLACEGGSRTQPSVPPNGDTGTQAGAGPAGPGDAVVVELRFDETMPVGALRLRWLELGDSRCPLGVQCVWEGQAVVTLEVSGDEVVPERVELTLRAGVEAAARAVAGRELRLLGVDPYPREGVTASRDEYVATIDLRPRHAGGS